MHPDESLSNSPERYETLAGATPRFCFVVHKLAAVHRRVRDASRRGARRCSTAQHELTANALTADALSPSARNVLRRWVLSERYDDDPAGAIAALHTIATMAAVTKTK